MSIKVENKDNYSVVSLAIEKLDSIISPSLKSEIVMLNKSGEKNIIVDLAQVKYCDSSGLSALLVGNRLCNELDGTFVINSLQPMVQKLLEISQLDKVLKITTDMEEAKKIVA